MDSPDKNGPHWSPVRSTIALLLVAVGLAGAVVLYLFNPTEHGFYPRCLLYQMTGWECPGCGSLRALHQLTHGHLAAAFRFNPLLILLLPLALGLGAREMFRQVTGRKLREQTLRPGWGWILVTVIVVFGVARNLPWFQGWRG